MVHLTAEQRQAVEKAAESPLRLTDPETQREYILLRAEVYERLMRIQAAEVIDPSLYEFEEMEEDRP